MADLKPSRKQRQAIWETGLKYKGSSIPFGTIECYGCGNLFQPTHGSQTRCKKNCNRRSATAHRARTKRRKEQLPTFVGIDGEGETHGDEHRYVLLSIGNESLHKGGEHLDFLEIMEFLWDYFTSHDESIAYVGYFLGYDFSQWFRTLPEHRARILFSPEKRARTKSGGNRRPFYTEYYRWQFDILGMKRFRLKQKNDDRIMYICDAGSYFQMPFAKAMHPTEWGNIRLMNADEQQIIEWGKAHRGCKVDICHIQNMGECTARLGDGMIRYNQTENEILSRMMTELASGVWQMGLKLNKSQWMGPGQIAQKWMRKVAPDHITEKLMETVPVQVFDTARKAYFGGWFELMAHGHIPGVTYEYDINSAYPSVHSTLPCLIHGEWTAGKGEPPEGEYVLVHGHFKGSSQYIGPLPHRSSKHQVFRPNETIGWHWLHEVRMAERAGLLDSVDWIEWVKYEPPNCPPPFEKLASLFETRKRARADRNESYGKSLKLVYNSCYGKNAQSVGNPVFGNAIFASLITAGCRTKILEAIATHPNGAADVLMVATDGIYFRTRHPNLKLSKNLGDWEEKEKINLTLFMPGIYWDDTTRESIHKEDVKIKSRGVSARDLIKSIGEIDKMFELLRPATMPEEWHWPTLPISVNMQLVSPKLALHRGKWETCGRITQDDHRIIDSRPGTKRFEPWSENAKIRNNFLEVTIEGYSHPTEYDLHILRSFPYNPENYFYDINSVPYNKTFGIEIDEEHYEDDWIHPDGMGMMDFYELLNIEPTKI